MHQTCLFAWHVGSRFCALTGSVVYCWLQRRSTRRLSEISKRHVDK
ncbi:hypothetical protein IC611_01700 [Proteus mirabilis]